VSGVAEASLSNADLLPGGAGSGPSRGGKAFNAAGSDLDMDDLDSDLNLNTDDDGSKSQLSQSSLLVSHFLDRWRNYKTSPAPRGSFLVPNFLDRWHF